MGEPSLACGIPCHTLCSPPAISCGRMKGHWAWGFRRPSRWGNARERRVSFLSISQRHLWGGLSWVSATAACPVFHNPFLSLTQVTRASDCRFLYRIHRDCYCYPFSIVVVYRSSCLWSFCVNFILVAWDWSSDVEDNAGKRASRRSCHVMCANIWDLHRNLSDLSLTARGGDDFFFVLRH